MAEVVLNAWTMGDRSFEVVLTDDRPEPIDDPTRRNTTLSRVFTRGDISVLGGEQRDVLLTVGRDNQRRIIWAARLTLTHLDLQLTAQGLIWRLPFERGQVTPFDLYTTPALGDTIPLPGTRLSDYLGRAPQPLLVII